MDNRDYDEFSMLLDAAYDLIGSGANKTISSQAKALFFKALGQYSIEQFRMGLNGHCIDKQRGRFTPKPADIIEQIEGATGGDGRPSDDEAWAIALTSQDEADTVVWTTETAESFGICQPVKAQWVASLGWDMERRNKVIEKAVTAGLLPAPMATALLPNYSKGEFGTECPQGLLRLKAEMARMNALRDEELAMHERSRVAAREAEAERKRELAEQAARISA